MMKIPTEPPAGDGIQLFNTSGKDIPITQQDCENLIQIVCSEEIIKFQHLDIAFVNEVEIKNINREYLGKDYITDTISFRLDEADKNHIEGVLYNCTQRIMEQSQEFKQDTRTEFLRVILHGVLHLAGYEDSNPEKRSEMKQLENHYLEHFKSKL